MRCLKTNPLCYAASSHRAPLKWRLSDMRNTSHIDAISSNPYQKNTQVSVTILNSGNKFRKGLFSFKENAESQNACGFWLNLVLRVKSTFQNGGRRETVFNLPTSRYFENCRREIPGREIVFDLLWPKNVLEISHFSLKLDVALIKTCEGLPSRAP